MKRTIVCAFSFFIALSLCGAPPSKPSVDAKERPFGIPERTPWTTSRLTGTPEPPLPYKVERVFPKLAFKNPLLITSGPGGRFYVAEHQGKMLSFPNDQSCAKADLFLDPFKDLHSWDKKKVQGVDTVYGLAFHPQFAKNRYCYICYVLNSTKGGEQLPDGSRVSRFKVTDTDPPRVDPKSEKIIITWLAGGHNGGDLHFGNDGFLYISTGDGSSPNPPDALDTGQDVSDLLSSILRIDVDHEDKGKAYAIPPDNPFLKTPKARPEIWSYGFRNPWRMGFDKKTGDLWVGDVGWELWEMIYRVKKGGNYGWSVMEGPQVVRPESRRGPTPILPPALAFPHTEAASITGGYVYRGKRLKELDGTYICGDWVTRKIWGTKFDGDKVVSHKEIALGTGRVVAFGLDPDGELYILNYEEVGTIGRLIPNEAAKNYKDNFPRKLSETGLFASVKDQQPAAGVIPFSVNVEQWADHAIGERFVALPARSSAKMYDNPVSIPGGFFSGQVFFPKDGMLAKTISLEMEAGKPQSRKRLETQVLHFDGELWRGYTYQWNDAQTDAVLMPAAGGEKTYTVIDPKAPGGKRRQTWHFHSRTECMTCHNPWAGHALAFTLPQLNKDHDYGGVKDNQIRAFKHIGLVALLHKDWDGKNEQALDELPAVRLSNPHDKSADLNNRARSYLHVNCSHCHQFGAGGTADLELRYNSPLDQLKIVDVRPVQGAFEIPGAHILSPGEPYRSVLYYRMGKLGRGRMPHIGSDIVDHRGLNLIHDWIERMPTHKDELALFEKLRALDETAILARQRSEAEPRVKIEAQAIAKTHGRQMPNADDHREAEIREKARAEAAAKRRAAERAGVIKQLLASTPSAMRLARAIGQRQIPDSVRSQVVDSAMALPDAQVRDLFERFVPDDKRVKRLGSIIKPADLLAKKGDAERGKQLFFKSAGLQCVNCHRINGTGSTLGPDLSQIAKKYTKAQILESILEPSKSIDPKYVQYLVETKDGKFESGLLVDKNDREVILKTLGDKEIRIPAKKVVTIAPQKNSIMPELLLRDLTAEQAADLLEFLASLK
jgi:putative heme-binding domain-containing protein